VTEAGGLSKDNNTVTDCGGGAGYFDPCHLPDRAFYAIDIGSDQATVIAAKSGTIVQTGTGKKCGGTPNCLVIDHHDGYFTEYREFTERVGIRLGDWVGEGSPLGTLPGPNGTALHFQVMTDPNVEHSSALTNSKLQDVWVGGCLISDYRLQTDRDGLPVRPPSCMPPLGCLPPIEPTSINVWRGGAFMRAIDAKDYANAAHIASDAVRGHSLASDAVGKHSLSGYDSVSGEEFMGAIYLYGWGYPVDCPRAVSWFRIGAAKGHAPAQFALGYALYYGLGVAMDRREAAKLWRQSSDWAASQSSLGTMYFDMYDYKQARTWYQKAAEQGFSVGQVMLGYMYEQGLGGGSDLDKARDWYQRAASQGDSYAAQRLQSVYYSH
jgi:hypothetical protein